MQMAEDVDSLTPEDKEEHVFARELLDIRYSLDSKGIKYNWTMEVMPLISRKIEDCYSRMEAAAAQKHSDSSDEFSETDCKVIQQKEKTIRIIEARKKREKRLLKKAATKRGPGRPKGSKNKIRY